MKHQWKTDDHGKVVPFDEDSEHPVAECVACGTHSACLTAQEPGYRTCWQDDGPKLDADDCEGLDLTVEVQVTIRYPGKATCYDDRSSVTQGWLAPLTRVVDADADLVVLELEHLAAEMADQWRIVRNAHGEDWAAAVANEEPTR
jgi:hypothetical protein